MLAPLDEIFQKVLPGQAEKPTGRHEALTPGRGIFQELKFYESVGENVGDSLEVVLNKIFLHSDALGPKELCAVDNQPGSRDNNHL